MDIISEANRMMSYFSKIPLQPIIYKTPYFFVLRETDRFSQSVEA